MRVSLGDNNINVTINDETINRCNIWYNNTHTGIESTSNSGITRYVGTITGCSPKLLEIIEFKIV